MVAVADRGGQLLGGCLAATGELTDYCPMVTAPSKRKRRQKDRPWSMNIPRDDWDDIVIGSGMGGMVAAAILAKLGRRVLVVEQHYVPGGFTHTFKRPHYEWDVGVHAVGEVTEQSMTGRLLKDLTDDRLKWASLGPVYDQFWFPDDVRIDFPDNPKQFRENLCEAFPNDAASIDAYLSKVREVAAAMKPYYLKKTLPRGVASLSDRLLGSKAQSLLEMNTAATIAKITSNPKLQAALTAQWGYYGSVPSRSSFAIQALVAKHFMWGGYYPVGGSGEIALQLLQTVADAGGWTAVKADVEQITIEGGRATGVSLKGGRRLRAKRVISAAGVAATVGRLLPESHAKEAWARSVLSLEPAPAHICLYLGFKGDIREAGASGANKWFYDTWDHESQMWNVSPGAEISDAACLYCSFPSLKDPLHEPGPEQRHTGEVVTFVPYEEFAAWRDKRWKRRGEDYEAFKQKMTERILSQFFKKLPVLKPMLDYAELSTPLSTEHFVRPQAGSIYGLEPTPRRFKNEWLRPRSPITGLFFAGSEVGTVGVIGAMMGGVLAATAAEPIDALRYLKRHM